MKDNYLNDKKHGEQAESYFKAVLSTILNADDNIMYITNTLKLANQTDYYYIPIKTLINGRWKNTDAFAKEKEFMFHIVSRNTVLITPISALKTFAQKYKNRITVVDDKQYLVITPANLATLGSNKLPKRYNKNIRDDIKDSDKKLAVNWDLELEIQFDKYNYVQAFPKKFLSMFGDGCKFEIKRDRIAFFTQNYFIEFAKRYKRTNVVAKKGILTTDADYYVFMSGQSMLVTNVRALKKSLKQFEKDKKVIKTGGAGALGFLLRIKDVLSFETFDVSPDSFLTATSQDLYDSDISILLKNGRVL